MSSESNLRFRICKFWLNFFTSLSFGWIGLTGVAFVANLFTENSFGAFIFFLLGGGLAFVMGLVMGSHVDHERLLHLNPRILRKRVGATILVCIGLPLGCHRIGTLRDVSEAELTAYSRDHRSELNYLIQLHQRDPQLGASLWQGRWGSLTGGSKNLNELLSIVNRLPGVKAFSSGANPPSIEITLSENSSAFLDFTRRGLIYPTVPADGDKLVAAGYDFDAVPESDQRVIKAIDSGWGMFHFRISD